MKVGVINKSEPRLGQSAGAELTGVTVSQVAWRFNRETGFEELVRRSDGQVLDRRRPTKQGAQDMKKETAEAKASKEFGNKYGHLTIGPFAGRHETSGTVLVDATCDCGKEVPGMMLNEITSGKRPYCDKRTCPVAESERSGKAIEGEGPSPEESKPRRTVKRRSAATVGTAAKPRRASSGRKGSAGSNNNSLEPVSAKAAATVAAPVNGGGRALVQRDFASISAVVESLAVIAEQVSIEDAASLVDEVRRQASQPAARLQVRGLPNYDVVFTGYLKVAEAFLAFRIGIE